jgi:NADH dehydrogenase [ubiquinone] 1 alpha subcomplex assembly factor 7
MNPLEREIRTLIEIGGPIPVSRYIALCLNHPRYGYYRTRDPLGRGGDFTTAPEISQMFGELLGLWCAEVWRLVGSPARFALVELGPGRGTLMKDLLRVGRALPGFLDAAEIHLVETSEPLRDAQRGTLENAAGKLEWHPTAATLPQLPLIALANEFVDALPFDQFERRGGHWHERRIGVNAEGALGFGLTPAPSGTLTLERDAPEGAIVERRDLSALSPLLAAIGRHRGAALFVDYGHSRSGFGDTLQAVRDHAYADPLAAPGESDLSAQVDFSALAALASPPVIASGPVTQGQLLFSLGIEHRADRLRRDAGPESRAAIASALLRLTGPAPDMGERFKALAFRHEAIVTLPGFDRPHPARESSEA